MICLLFFPIAPTKMPQLFTGTSTSIPLPKLFPMLASVQSTQTKSPGLQLANCFSKPSLCLIKTDHRLFMLSRIISIVATRFSTVVFTSSRMMACMYFGNRRIRAPSCSQALSHSWRNFLSFANFSNTFTAATNHASCRVNVKYRIFFPPRSAASIDTSKT